MNPLSFSSCHFHARGLLALLSILAIPDLLCQAQDWPQILGPNRDGTTVQLPMQPEKWLPTLKPTWEMEIGSGYAGAAIAGDVVYIPHRQDKLEILTAIELASGRRLWQSTWPASYRGTINPDDGPRCVPNISGNRVLCYGAAGDLVCFDKETGAEIWRRALRKDYQAEDGYFGAGSSPIVVGNLVITCVGGRDGGIVAVELENGNTRWTATDYDASYASPIAFDLGSEQVLLVVTRLRVVLVNAADGSVLSELQFGSRGPTVNAATPIALDSLNRSFLLTSSYNVGTLVAKVEGLELKEQYRNRRLLASQYNSPVRNGKFVYGIDGREDVGNGKLRAIDPESQEVLWEVTDFGTAHLIGFEQSILAMDLNGRLVLFEANETQYQPLAETQLPTSTYRALPALAGRNLVVRGSDRPGSSRLILVKLP